MKVLRIVFCILSCLCVAAAVPVGIFFEWWCLVPVVGCLLFALAMIACKNKHDPPKKELKPDFMNTDEENEQLKK